jgi:hypothetical protein
MAKRGKRNKRQEATEFMARSKVAPGSDQEYDVAFRVGEPIDREKVAKLRDSLAEISDAGFEEEEENELLFELLQSTHPLVRGAAYLTVAAADGEPVVVEDELTGDSYELTLVDNVVQKRKIKKAEFGVRDQKDNIEHAIDLSEPPFQLSAEEMRIWQQSPGMLLGMRIASGDRRWANFLDEIQAEAQEQYDQEAETLENFFALQAAMSISGKDTSVVDPDLGVKSADHESKGTARLLSSLIRRARVFHIDPVIYQEVYHACDRYCTEVVSGLSFKMPKVEGNYYVYDMDEPKEETEQHVNSLREASPTAPMPEKFPFEVMYLGFGPGIYLQQYQAETKFLESGKRLPPGIARLYTIGALITSTGHVFECFKIIKHDESVGYVAEAIRHPNVGFLETFDLAPWYIPKLVEFITSHKMYVLEQDVPLDIKRQARKARKATKKGYHPNALWSPSPYYRLRMKDTVLREKTPNLFPQPGKPRTYRTDVVGHDRLYVRRGPLPLDDKKRAVLVAREYKIYENTMPPPETTGTMIRKGHTRKLPEEWVAVREIWIDDHMNVNDPELPYVPAIRTTGPRPPLQGSPPEKP